MGSVQWLISPMMPCLLILYDGRLSFDLERLAQYEVMLAIFAVCFGLDEAALICVHRKLHWRWFGNMVAYLEPYSCGTGSYPGLRFGFAITVLSHLSLLLITSCSLFADQSPGWLRWLSMPTWKKNNWFDISYRSKLLLVFKSSNSDFLSWDFESTVNTWVVLVWVEFTTAWPTAAGRPKNRLVAGSPGVLRCGPPGVSPPSNSPNLFI